MRNDMRAAVLRLNSPVKISPSVADSEELKPHANRIFRVIGFDDNGRVSIHSVGGDPSSPTMIFGMGKSELVILNARV